VGVGDEDIGVERTPGFELEAEPAEAGSAIENQVFAVVLDDAARGVATIADGPWSRDRDRTTDALEPE
jgi:hypothetical protein